MTSFVMSSVVFCCVRSCDMGKIDVYHIHWLYDKIVTKNKKKITHGNQINLYINHHLKKDFVMEFTAG